MRFFEARQIRVPDDLEVISFDNFAFSEYSNPALTTWDIGFHRLGIRAQELLTYWLKGEELAHDHYELFLPVFVPRQSHRGEL
jgi:DNA-binding LacI/PurR family transcriptional regulator